MPIDGNILLGVAFDPASYSNAQRQLQNLSRRATVDLKVNHAPLGRINADLHEFDKSLQAANARVLAFGASTGAVYGIGRAFTEITKSFINIEAKFKSIQVVLNSTTAVFENFKGSIFAIGRDTGKSFEEVTDAAQELVRQGLKISETLQRTSDAMILSRQSGLSASEAVTSLTAALNTFNQEALTSTQVINKLANVDTNFAVSQKDLIDAISRSGSAAQDAGVQFDKLLSLTTSLQQTTARGGAVIGNALKSIFTRVQRSTTLEALEEFNIQTKDLQGNILSADVLLQNLAKTYKTLSTAEKSALSEQVAGIQQINQLKALLADLARANSVYSQALKTSSSSVNEAIDRNKSLNETLKATLNATKLNALEFSETVGKLALAPALKLPLGSANALFDIFKDKDQDSKGTGQKIGEGILRGIGSVLSGPGLVLATAIITNTLKELGRFTFSVISDYSSLNNKTKEQINVQHAISQILSDGNNKYAARLAAAKSIKEEEAAIRLIMLEQNNIVARKSAMYAQPVRNIVSSGGDVTREGAFKLPKKAAGGYLPVYEEYQDIQRGVGGASRAARPKIIPNFNFGGGKRGTIVANTDEYIVPNYAGGDGSAIFNPNMVARHGLPQGARKINAAGGYTPNFANFKTKIFGKNYRGMERVITSGSGSELLFNHKQNYLEIKDIHSQNKGEGFQMFQKLLQFGAKRKKPIFSDFLVSQRGTASDQNLQGSNNYEKLITRFPQMRYRDTQLGQKTSGVIIRNQNEGDNYEPETIEFQTLKEFKDKINSIENFRASKIKIEKLFTQPFSGGFIPNFAPNHILKYLKSVDPSYIQSFQKIRKSDPQLAKFLRKSIDQKNPEAMREYSQFMGGQTVQITPRDYGLKTTYYSNLNDSPENIRNKTREVFTKFEKESPFAGGFIPNFADYELNDSRQYVYSANNLDIPERILARRKGVELLTANDIDELEGTLGSRKLKIIDPSNELNDRNNILRKTIGRGLQNFAITGAVTQDFDKFEETRLGSIGLQKSFLLSDLGLKGNKKSKLDQIDKIAADNFGSDDYFLKGKYGYQGNQVVDAETLRQLGGIPKRLGKNLPELKQQELFIQRKIPNSNDREFRVDIAGVGGQGRLLSRANFRGMNGRLVQEAFKESEDRSFRDYFRPEYLQKEFGGNDFIGKLSGLKRYVGDTLSRKIAETQALRQFNSLDSAQKNGTIAGLDVIETGNRGLKKLLQYGAEKLNLPYFKGGGVIEYNFTDSVSKSGGLSKLSTLVNSGKALRDNSSFNVNEFVNRGKGILGLSGKEQKLEFAKFNKDLLNLRKFDESGYLSTAKQLNELGFGITTGRGRRKQQIGGSEAAGLFKRLGFAGGFIPNYADPLSEAIQREQAAGLPLNQIKVENHPSLISNLNPGGLAVTNKRDEPGGITQGISRAIKEGRDPKKYGAAKGLIPNFAPSFFPDPTFTEGTVKALGMTGNVSPASRAKIKDFTTGIKLSEQDLLLPTQDLKKKIQASITQAFKIDPRFVKPSFEKGAEKIADAFVQTQQGAMIKAYQKNLKAGQDDYVRQELVGGVTDKINRQSGFFGGFRNNKIIKEVENSPEYKKLSNEAKLSTSRELNNLAFDNSEKRGAKLQSRALTASFGIPVATGALLSQLNPNDPKSKKFAGIAEGVSTGLSVAAIGGFSPLAVGAGLVLGGGSIASSLAKSKRKSPEQLSEELTNARGKFESSRNAVLGTFQGQDALKEAIEKGSSLGQVRQLSRQITDSISGIENSSLRNKVIAAKTDEERANVIDEINKVGIQKVSRTGLASKLEESISPSRGILSDYFGDTKSIVLKPQDIKDIGSLVAGASPLKFDKDGKVDQKQLAGLQELSKKGDFNIDEVEKVLGNLQISRESRNQLGQFTVGSQKAIAKDVVERQLSIAALDKNNEGLVKFNNLLLRVGKTLDTLSSNLDFKFKIQNINTAGIRDRAISGASQSLGGISEFLSPELRNKQESLIAGTQIENQRISTINEATTGWVKSLRDLENAVPAALKGNDDGQGGEGYSAKGEPLKREFREILTKVIANGKSDPVSAGLEGLKELKNLNAKFDKSNDPNGKLKDAVLKFTQGLTQNISVADAVAANSKASLDQTTKINELIISLQKSQNFLGGGTFESSKDLDFSKIQSSSRLTRQFKDDLTNPSKDRIYKSRGNSFDDFFQGKQIDEKAETARRASNLGTLASGSLQLSQLGLLDKEGTQKARLEVAAAEKAQLENQLNKLEEIGQTSGDFNLLDSIRNIRKSGIVNDAAAARSLKQVPLLAEEGGGDPLSKLAELSGPLGDLSKNIVNLNSNFQTGVQGGFTELSKQAYAAAKELFDLSVAASLSKENAENEKQAKSALDKANLIKDKQTRQNELKEKKVNLSKNELKNLERNTGGSDKTFSDRVDRNFTDRRLGFLGLGSGKGLEKINLGPNPRFGISQFGDPDREYFQSNAASLGVPKAGINEILDSTVEINSSNSSKTTKDLVETVKRLVSGDRDKAISIFEQLVASKPANFNNVGKADSQISGRNIEDLQKGPRQILERLIKTYNYLEKQTSETKSIDDEISTLDREIQELSNKSRGLIPNLSMGSSFLKEKRDIAKGIGGARPGDSPYITHLAGVGPAVVNTGEKIIRNFAGGGKDAVFNRKMMNFAGGLSFPIYDGKEKMNLSDNRAPGIYENGKLISASAPTQKQNSFTRPKNAYERNIGSVLANAELNSQGQRVSIVGSKYGAGYSQFDKGGGFGEYRNSTDYINSEIAKGNPINPENFKPVYADEDSSNSLTANPVNSSGIRPARTIPLKTIAETTKDQNEYFKQQRIQAKLNNSIRTPAKYKQFVESLRNGSKSNLSDFAGVTEDAGTSSDFFGNKFKDRSTEFNKNFLKEGNNGYVSLRDKMDDSFSDSGSPFQDSKIQGSGGLGSVSLQGSQRFGGSNKSPDQLEKHYSKTRRGDDTKFDRNTTNTRGKDDRGLIESMNKLTAALNSKNKPADGDKPGDIVKPEVAVKHDINVNVVVGGEVNTQDQRVKDIIKQETEQFKQNVENRIKALENKNNGLPPPPPAAVPTS